MAFHANSPNPGLLCQRPAYRIYNHAHIMDKQFLSPGTVLTLYIIV